VNAHHARIAASLERVRADLAVILFVDPPLAGEVGAGHQLEQVRADIAAFGHVLQRFDLRPGLVFFLGEIGPVIERRICGERPQGNVAHHLAVPFEHHMLRVGDFADHRKIELPFAEDRFGHAFLAGLQDHEHPLLAFAQHHFVRRHSLFAAWHLVHVEPDAGLAIGRHFDAGAGEARRAHVLYGDNRVGRHQFEAGLDQQLFGEGIADLHRGPLGLGIFAEVGARHGRAMNTVTPGFGADIDDWIAHAGRRRVEYLVGIGHAHGHRIDQDIAVIGRVEIGFTRHRRHANAIAVAADPRDHTLYQMLHLGMLGTPETQRIGVGYWPRAHGEHVAQDPANPRRRTLVGLNRRLAVADVDHAGVLARAADHPRGLGRQPLEVEAARFVRAMLAPHHGKDAQFDEVGLAPQRVKYALIFLGRKPVLVDDFGCDLRGRGSHASALSASLPLSPVPCAFVPAVCPHPARHEGGHGKGQQGLDIEARADRFGMRGKPVDRLEQQQHRQQHQWRADRPARAPDIPVKCAQRDSEFKRDRDRWMIPQAQAIGGFSARQCQIGSVDQPV